MNKDVFETLSARTQQEKRLVAKFVKVGRAMRLGVSMLYLNIGVEPMEYLITHARY